MCSAVASNNLGARARLLPQAAMGVCCSLNHLVPSVVFPPFPLSSAAPALTPTTTTSHTSDRPVVLLTWFERGEEGEEERRERETNTPPTHTLITPFLLCTLLSTHLLHARSSPAVSQASQGGAGPRLMGVGVRNGEKNNYKNDNLYSHMEIHNHAAPVDLCARISFLSPIIAQLAERGIVIAFGA